MTDDSNRAAFSGYVRERSRLPCLPAYSSRNGDARIELYDDLLTDHEGRDSVGYSWFYDDGADFSEEDMCSPEDAMTLVMMARASDGVVITADNRATFRRKGAATRWRCTDGITKVRAINDNVLCAFPGVGQSAESLVVDHLAELASRSTAVEAALIVRKHLEEGDPAGPIYFASASSRAQIVNLHKQDDSWVRPRAIVQERYQVAGVETVIALLVLENWLRDDDDVVRIAGALIAAHRLTADVTCFVSPACDCRVIRCGGVAWTEQDERQAQDYAEALVKRLKTPPWRGPPCE
jgi:hypothetical protein